MDDVHPGGGVRHSILDLAPLELDCMNALWPVGEATVRDIQQALQPTRPRAYTTIMTILDRLAQKGIVLRRKLGRAWVYQPVLTAHEARSQALAHLVDGFFGGSSEGLVTHLASQGAAALAAVREAPREITTAPVPPATGFARPAATRSFEAATPRVRPTPRAAYHAADPEAPHPSAEPEKPARSALDTTLL